MDRTKDDGHRPGQRTPVVALGARPPPYPPDVRAKGWRFEFDYEEIDQSLAWAMAPPEVRPWLIMMLITAWKQSPCGSLEDDDSAIAARMGMPSTLFEQHRELLRRGWWRAEDSRLYHDTLIERVTAMQAKRGGNTGRQANRRAKAKADPVKPQDVTRDNTVTKALVPRELPISHDTRTRTRTSNTPPYPPHAGGGGGGDSAEPTKTEVICKAIQARGVVDADPGDPKLQAYVDKGVKVETFEAAAITTAKAGKGMAYLLGIVKRQMGEAAQVTNGPDAPTEEWDATRSSIEARGVALGIGRWNDKDLSANRETFGAYTERVRRAIGTGEVAA